MRGDFSKVPSLKPKLQQQVEKLREHLASVSHPYVMGILLYGSAVRGEATYRSDLDLLVILKQPKLVFSDVQAMRDFLEEHFARAMVSDLLSEPLPVQFTVVRDSVFQTEESEMRNALSEGLILFDPQGDTQRALAALEDGR